MLCIGGTGHGHVSVCVCVRLSQVGVLSKRLNESSWCLTCELPSIRPTLCSKETRLLPKNKGNSLWNFVLNSGLRKLRHGISIVETCYQLSSKKVDAHCVINWAVVGQLSRQYLRVPTLDYCSLSHRSSRAVYCTILSKGSISDSWYLVQDLSYK